MPLTVLNVAYALGRVAPDAAGGAEQVLWQLDRALVEAGHRSLVVASADSRVAGALIATPPVAGPLDEGARRRAVAAQRAAVAQAVRTWPIDVVHMHGLDFADCLPPPGVPVLVTLHLPLDWYPPHALRPERPGTFLHCVSASQAARADLALLPVIGNGIDIDWFRPRRGNRRRYVAALGRICPEKGLHLAVEAARRADVPLLVAGAVHGYAAHTAYFAEVLAPALDRRRRYIGPVGRRRKRHLLAGARCLLVPSLVAETSSLVAMEALACGTPVVAFRAGALAEVVEHGRTGFLVDDADGMAAAIAAAAALDPDDCRRAACARFAASMMSERYLARYAALAVRRHAA